MEDASMDDLTPPLSPGDTSSMESRDPPTPPTFSDPQWDRPLYNVLSSLSTDKLTEVYQEIDGTLNITCDDKYKKKEYNLYQYKWHVTDPIVFLGYFNDSRLSLEKRHDDADDLVFRSKGSGKLTEWMPGWKDRGVCSWDTEHSVMAYLGLLVGNSQTLTTVDRTQKTLKGIRWCAGQDPRPELLSCNGPIADWTVLSSYDGAKIEIKGDPMPTSSDPFLIKCRLNVPDLPMNTTCTLLVVTGFLSDVKFSNSSGEQFTDQGWTFWRPPFMTARDLSKLTGTELPGGEPERLQPFVELLSDQSVPTDGVVGISSDESGGSDDDLTEESASTL